MLKFRNDNNAFGGYMDVSDKIAKQELDHDMILIVNLLAAAYPPGSDDSIACKKIKEKHLPKLLTGIIIKKLFRLIKHLLLKFNVLHYTVFYISLNLSIAV
jgi:hypothetical protein